MTNQLVSIIIPLYNRELLILETLESVQNQSYNNWECIVVDDGSTDNSYSVVKNLSDTEKRIKLYKRENEIKGAPSCREIGFKKSNGEFIIYLDSDDLLAPWALKKRINYFINNIELDVLISNGIQFNSKNKKLLDFTTIYNTKEILNDFLKFKVVFQTSSPTWKRSFLIDNEIHWNPKSAPWDDVDYTIQSFSKEPLFKWNDKLPDYFLRREDDINALTSISNIVEKVFSNFITYEKWLLNKKNKTILMENFPNYMLSKFEFLFPKKDLKEFINKHPELIKKHLGKRTLIYLKIFVLTKEIFIVRSLIYRIRPFFTNIKRDNKEQIDLLLSDEITQKTITQLRAVNSPILKKINNV